MPKAKDPKYVFKSYRLDRDTSDLIDRLKLAMRDPETNRPRTEADVIRIAIRRLAEIVEAQ